MLAVTCVCNALQRQRIVRVRSGACSIDLIEASAMTYRQQAASVLISTWGIVVRCTALLSSTADSAARSRSPTAFTRPCMHATSLHGDHLSNSLRRVVGPPPSPSGGALAPVPPPSCPLPDPPGAPTAAPCWCWSTTRDGLTDHRLRRERLPETLVTVDWQSSGDQMVIKACTSHTPPDVAPPRHIGAERLRRRLRRHLHRPLRRSLCGIGEAQIVRGDIPAASQCSDIVSL